MGESERGIREIFKKARQAVPCIIFFDEIDAIAPTRGGRNDNGVTERVIAQSLTEMDGLDELKGVTVLAASNRVDMIDPALLRAGRTDLQIELPKPVEEGRQEVFKGTYTKTTSGKKCETCRLRERDRGVHRGGYRGGLQPRHHPVHTGILKTVEDQVAFVIKSSHFSRAIEDVRANISNTSNL